MTAIADVNYFITTLSAAYERALTGKLKHTVRIGGTDFYTAVQYVQPTPEEILKHLKYWQGIAQELSRQERPNNVNQFNTNNSIPLIVR